MSSGSSNPFKSSAFGSVGGGDGGLFRPSALAQLTSHIDTKVRNNQDAGSAPEDLNSQKLFGKSSKADQDEEPEAKFSRASQTVTTKALESFSPRIPAPSLPNTVDATATDKPRLIFGSHISAKVVNPGPSSPTSPQDGDHIKETPVTAADLFSMAAKEAATSPVTDSPSTSSNSNVPILRVTPASADFSSASGSKFFTGAESHKVLPSTQIETGEENEDSLFHATCKLHIFDSQKSVWGERGQGLVKVNRDRKTRRCRLVMRQTGILKLLLNSPIFGGMRLKAVSARGVHVTAIDIEAAAPHGHSHDHSGQQLRVFLLTATTPTEASNLFQLLSRLVDDLNKAAATAATGDHVASSVALESQPLQAWDAAASTRSGKHRRTEDDGNVRRGGGCTESSGDADSQEEDNAEDEISKDDSNSEKCGGLSSRPKRPYTGAENRASPFQQMNDSNLSGNSEQAASSESSPSVNNVSHSTNDGEVEDNSADEVEEDRDPDDIAAEKSPLEIVASSTKRTRQIADDDDGNVKVENR